MNECYRDPDSSITFPISCKFSMFGGAGEDSVGFGLSGLSGVSRSMLSPLIGFNSGPGASPTLSDISVVSGKSDASLYLGKGWG